jgi:hypothetical protein
LADTAADGREEGDRARPLPLDESLVENWPGHSHDNFKVRLFFDLKIYSALEICGFSLVLKFIVLQRFASGIYI